MENNLVIKYNRIFLMQTTDSIITQTKNTHTKKIEKFKKNC